MKQLGKLIRAKRAEKQYSKMSDQGFWKDIKVESVFGGEAIITQQRTITSEKESEQDNEKIQALLLKHKKVFYLNCYVPDTSYSSPFLFTPYIPLQVTPTIFKTNTMPTTTIPAGTNFNLPTGGTVSIGSTIILKSRSVGATTMNSILSNTTNWSTGKHMSGFRIFVAAKEEKELIHKLSRALKYDFML